MRQWNDFTEPGFWAALALTIAIDWEGDLGQRSCAYQFDSAWAAQNPLAEDAEDYDAN